METKQKNKLCLFSEACRTRTISLFQVFSSTLGNAIFNHETWFVVVPALVALVLGVIALVTAKPQAPFASAIKDMFVLHNNANGRMKTFEDKWFGDTWAKVGYTSNCGQLVIRSKSERDLLTTDGISGVLALHRHLTQVTAYDASSNRTIAFLDVCLKRRRAVANSTSEHSQCYLDPLLEVFHRSRNDKTSTIFVDDKVGAPYMEVSSIVSDPTDLENDKTEANGEKIFLERGVGLLDFHTSLSLSARAVRITYLLQDDSNNASDKSVSLWLRKFEDAALEYKIDGADIIVMTTESIGREWLSLIGLQPLHVTYLCCVAAALLGLYIAFLDGVCLASFLVICVGASLAMSLGSTYTIHLLSIGNPSFNFAQVAVFVAAFQPLIQVRFLHVLVFKTQKQSEQNQKVLDAKKYVEEYQKSLTPSFACYLVFVATFLATALSSTELGSFRHFSSTACLGFTFNFIAQTVFLPACARLFERHLRQPIRALREIVLRSRARSLSSEAEERVLLEERPTEASTRKRPTRNLAPRQSTFQRTKKKLKDLGNSYFRGVVANYARPITVLFYLTYVSFGYVGCLHFTEMMEPRLLLLPESSAYKYLESAENDFKPFGPRFAVIGQFRGDPWQQEVLQELYNLHRDISTSPAVCRGLKENWFGRYVWYGTKDAMAALQQQAQQHYTDSMLPSWDPYDLTEEGLQPSGGETEEVFVLESIPQDIDWPGIWFNFTETAEYKAIYAKDIAFAERGVKSSKDSNSDRDVLTSFRWVFAINETVLPGEKRALLEWFDQLVERRDSVVVPELFIHSYELDWWRTIGAKAFDRPILILAAFALVMVFASLLLRTVWQTFFSALMAVSVSFGFTGFLSFDRIGLDPFTLPCVMFALPYANALSYDLLDIFTKGNGGGRSNWAQIALRAVAVPNYYCLLVLLCSFALLASNDFYGFRAPLTSLAALAVISVIHVYLFLPVMLTIFPPSKKITRGLPAAKGGPRSAQPSIRVVTDSRPHLHARRYFYDSQRAISFQSEDDPDGRIEHITCL